MWTDDFDILVNDEHVILRITHTSVQNTINQTSISMKFTMAIFTKHIRYSVDGKEYYYIEDYGRRPYLYEKIEDVPEKCRHLFAKMTEIEEIGPGMANFLGVGKILCPDLPECDHPYFLNTECLAELCRYAPQDDWRKCPYFKKD